MYFTNHQVKLSSVEQRIESGSTIAERSKTASLMVVRFVDQTTADRRVLPHQSLILRDYWLCFWRANASFFNLRQLAHAGDRRIL
jgi:hypothetical protein